MKTVILAGGTGTRLWPMSRQKKPKQFQPLIGEDTMLVQTIKRLSFQRPADIYISTNSEYLDLVREQTAGLVPAANIIVEPALRDTAPCIGLIASTLAEKNPEEIMAVIYADHLLQDQKELEQKLKVAAELARKENTLNIIEVKAVSPNVNLGYVKIGRQLKTVRGIPVHQLISFVEKPDLATAKKFLRSQSYLWNTGLFVWKISTILEKFRQFQPETWEILHKISDSKPGRKRQQALIDLYPLCQKISIDYAIMEKVRPEEVRIIPADLGWNDIGTWESIWQEIHEEKAEGLVTRGAVVSLESKNCLLYGQGKKVLAAIGLDGIIAVDTPDALLICRKDQSHKIKTIVEKLKKDFPEVL
jgi:mannose-1-phosphate guanylyltransferase